MISLENINIQYDKPLIQNGHLHIHYGHITGIKGKSGSGKTSLLYLIGLLSKDKNMKYLFDHTNINELNQNTQASFRRNEIGYVFQDNNLFENTTILENFKIISHLYHLMYSEKEFRQLLHQVRLNHSLNTPIKELSGGQKQRLAIALALIKKPKLLILDEPTSNLDETNTHLIMQILEEVSKSCMVVISSHVQIVLDYCKDIYEIKDRSIIHLKHTDELQKAEFSKTKKQSVPLKFYKQYILYFFSKNIQLLLVMLFSIAFALTTTSLSSEISNSFENYKRDFYNQLMTKDIVVTQLAINDESLIQTMTSISNVSGVYPIENWNIHQVNDLNYQTYVMPYMQEHGIENHLYQQYSQDLQGVYISQYLKNQLGDSQSIRFTLDNQIIETKILGVYDMNFTQNYLNNGEDIIYISHSLVEDLMTKSNTYIVFVDNIENMETVVNQLNQLYGINVQSEIQTLQQIEKNIDAIKQFGQVFSIILVIVTFTMMCLIFHQLFINRQYELGLLKANGLSTFELIHLILFECGFYLIIIIMFSLIFMILFNLSLPMFLSIKLSLFSWSTLLKYIQMTLGLFIIPLLVFSYFNIRHSPVEILRN